MEKNSGKKNVFCFKNFSYWMTLMYVGMWNVKRILLKFWKTLWFLHSYWVEQDMLGTVGEGWTHKQCSLSKNLHSLALCRYWVPSRRLAESNGQLGQLVSESKESVLSVWCWWIKICSLKKKKKSL